MTVLLPVFALLDAEQLGDQQKWLRVPEEGTGTHAGASVEPVISKIANYRRDLAILGIVRASDTHPLRNAQISSPCARFDALTNSLAITSFRKKLNREMGQSCRPHDQQNPLC